MSPRSVGENARGQSLSRALRPCCIPLLFVLGHMLFSVSIPAQAAEESENDLESYWRAAQEGLKQVDDLVAEVTALPDSLEMQIGNQIAAHLNNEFKVVEDHRSKYLKRLGARLARHTKRPAIIYRFNLIESDTVNAYSVAGGHVWLTTSMFDLVGDDEDQLAGVIGHEIAHVDNRHCIRRIQYRILAAGIDPEYANYVEVGYRAYERGYSQLNELESDRLGAKIVHSAGLNPWGLVRAMEKFAVFEPADSYSDNPETVADAVALATEFLRTHPPSAKRRERLVSYIRDNLEPSSPNLRGRK